MPNTNKYASAEQLRYAKIMSIGVKIGFAILVVSFILYMSGVLKPLVAVSQIPHYWGLSAAEYAKATGTPTGWAWVVDVFKGDMMNYLGIVILASVPIFSTLAVLPMLAKSGDKKALAISILLILVLLVSASNILH